MVGFDKFRQRWLAELVEANAFARNLRCRTPPERAPVRSYVYGVAVGVGVDTDVDVGVGVDVDVSTVLPRIVPVPTIQI